MVAQLHIHEIGVSSLTDIVINININYSLI